MNNTLYNVWHTLYNVQCILYYVQCTMYKMLCEHIIDCDVVSVWTANKIFVGSSDHYGGLNQMTIYIPHPAGVARYIECVFNSYWQYCNTITWQLLPTLVVKKSDYITLHWTERIAKEYILQKVEYNKWKFTQSVFKNWNSSAPLNAL